MYKLLRTDSAHPDYRALVAMLDADLKIRDGDDHAFFAQYNKSDDIKNVVICFIDEIAAGCGAFKYFDTGVVEIKRMFVRPDFRRKNIASVILSELEQWAAELSYSGCILETGKKQPEAIALYQKSGYAVIQNYGPYINVSTSVCMQKKLPG